MTVADLIELLEALDDPEREVLIVHQASYPLQETVSGLWDPVEDQDEVEDEDQENLVYLVAGGHPHNHSPYGPRAAFE